MKMSKKMLWLVLVMLLVVPPTLVEAAGTTYISNLRSSVSPATIRRSQNTTYTTSLQIAGNGRNNFNDTVWAMAYSVGMTRYTIRYTVSVREDRGLWFDREIVRPVTYTRTATIFASSNTPGPFWVRITLEDGRTVTPRTVREAQALMFDFSRSSTIAGSTLGTGTHKLFSKMQVAWSGYQFSGSDSKDSPRVTVAVRN
ncbi:MAG: hypothetical protein FJ026_03370 [Chloroflexi bacterium]|nr:hypothetical protein [Chloroflexota bacterium]